MLKLAGEWHYMEPLDKDTTFHPVAMFYISAQNHSHYKIE